MLHSSVIFFMMHLLSNSISRKLHQSLILLCEAHFALLYILQLNLISKVLEQKGSFAMEIISQLGKRFVLKVVWFNLEDTSMNILF